jgi:uncharacterized pyridoxal phosphate-containing UPF0001 family protein
MFMDLRANIQAVRERIDAAARAAGRDPAEITLCGATKVQTDDTIRAAIAAGVEVCGENRVQELCAHLEADAYAGAKQVHFIGHLQTNKVNKVVGRVELIHSVDSPRLLEAVDRQAEKLGIVQDILLQVLAKGTYQHQTAHQYDQYNCGSRTCGNLCQRNRNRSQRIQKLQGPMGIPLLTGLLCSPSDLLFIFHKEYPPIPRLNACMVYHIIHFHPSDGIIQVISL